MNVKEVSLAKNPLLAFKVGMLRYLNQKIDRLMMTLPSKWLAFMSANAECQPKFRGLRRL